jgi:hypothetical protein
MKNPRTPMFDFSALVEDPRIPATDYPEDTSMPLAWPAFAARMQHRMARVSPSPRVVEIPEAPSIPTAEVYTGRPGAIDRSLDITSRVNPLDLLTAAGYQDPNQIRRRNTANQRNRLQTERESAVGTAAGMLLGALLRGGEGADAVFDVSYPGLAGMESLIKFNRSQDVTEKGELDDAMKAYLSTIVKSEDMNVDISKANQRTAENWNAVRDVDKAVDSGNKLHMLTTRTSGAVEDRPLWEMPVKGEGGGDEGMTPYQRLQSEMAALKESRDIDESIYEIEKSIPQLEAERDQIAEPERKPAIDDYQGDDAAKIKARDERRNELAKSAAARKSYDDRIAAMQRERTMLKRKSNALARSMNKVGHKWSETPTDKPSRGYGNAKKPGEMF